MIKFFRHIRQQLLTEHKFRKYLGYAVGEIVLVMIGILLALQVNNWNINRNNSKQEIALLSQVTGLSSRKVNSWFTDKKLMYKKDDDWVTTKRGKEAGGIEKSGQYGQFIIWPEDITKHIVE
jgi:hypothetical protein